MNTYADGAEDDHDIETNQTTGTKLAFVSANLHCKQFQEHMSEATKERVEFDATDITFLEDLCSGAFKNHGKDKVDFSNWLEDWERNVKKKNEELMVRLRAKYISVRMHDHEDGDSDDSDDEGYDEVREINGIEFQSRKPKGFQGRWAKGYKLVTALVVDGGKLDDSKEALVPYEINEEIHNLITKAVNPTRTLLKKPAVGGGEQ